MCVCVCCVSLIDSVNVYIIYTVIYIYMYTVVPPFNGPSDERTPAMSGHYLDVRTVLPC